MGSAGRRLEGSTAGLGVEVLQESSDEQGEASCKDFR